MVVLIHSDVNKNKLFHQLNQTRVTPSHSYRPTSICIPHLYRGPLLEVLYILWNAICDQNWGCIYAYWCYNRFIREYTLFYQLNQTRLPPSYSVSSSSNLCPTPHWRSYTFSGMPFVTKTYVHNCVINGGRGTKYIYPCPTEIPSGQFVSNTYLRGPIHSIECHLSPKLRVLLCIMVIY